MDRINSCFDSGELSAIEINRAFMLTRVHAMLAKLWLSIKPNIDIPLMAAEDFVTGNDSCLTEL